MEELWKRDLVPYRFMIPEGLPAVMTGHLAFPTITDQSVPASVSPFFGKKVLRDRLEFDGLVITDDLYMGGATQYGRREGLSFAELCLQAVKSGNDMIMLSQTPVFDGPIWQTVFTEYQRNEAFRRSVRESVRRILRTKIEYLRPEDRVPLFPNPTALPESLANNESRQFFLEQAARSVTVIRNNDLPFTPSPDTEILLASQDSLFLKQGQKRYPNADTFLFRNRSFYSSSATDRRRFREQSQDYDVIIYNLADPNSLEVLQAAGALDARVIVFSTLTPVYLRELQDVETAIAVYGWGKASYRAGFSVLRGDFEAEGTLPFSLSRDE
jgi:beta-N-acetylhexosaminidase